MDEPKIEQSKKTALDMPENVEGALCYLFGFITGIIFLLMEKDNKFVRFHAVQSIVLSIALVIVNIVLFVLSVILGLAFSFLPKVSAIFSWLVLFIDIFLGVALLALWLLLMFKAYQGEKFKLPMIGDWAEQQAERM